MKRSLDVLISTFALVLLSPLLVCISVALRVLHGPPVLFRQSRVGLHGEPFFIHKFRTMDSDTGPSVTVGSDPRIHRFGRLLRASKLDELPQLWDVARGKMSIVGPRPELQEFVNHWPEEQRSIILSVRPGITDPASIQFRHESKILSRYENPRDAYINVLLPRKCDLYVAYASEPSLSKDLKLILQTVRALFRPT